MPGIIHKRIDPAKPVHRCFDNDFGDGALSDVTGHGYHPGITRFLNVAGIGDDDIAGISIAFHDTRSDALGGTCNDRDFLHLGHCRFLDWSVKN
jgi:hypothetical protein